MEDIVLQPQWLEGNKMWRAELSENAGKESASTSSVAIFRVSSEEVHKILAQAAAAHPDVLQKINAVVSAKRERERNRVINFDHYSKSAWKALNVTYRSMSASAQLEAACEVTAEINGTVTQIVSHGALGHEVHKEYQWKSALEEGMLAVIKAMEPQERLRIRQDDKNPEGLWPKMLEFEELAKDYCCFPKLGEVIDLLEDK
ncbi:hypothetical protein VTN77DRAFT_4740 [Rasamsonia byssochlamydoides]|uniref:uncharacterized protein n=1 Tax=Rasamsonia byssochlamydoides TaxID=89139 RepID=UPI0037437CCC